MDPACTPAPSREATPEELDKTVVGIEPVDPKLGAVFSGCKVELKLGQGGMGSVYLARRESDSQAVVVKFLAQEQAQNPTWRARFVREAMVMKKLSHPNLVSVFSIDDASSEPHIVMELVDGKGLDAALRSGPLPPLEAARIARDVALGLACAHESGIIHRDIKPANVLLTKDGEVKVLDFGLAKSVAFDDGLSLPGQVLGTPQYMAPEQWGDHEVDPRCDIFSLGATLYHLLTGTTPFPGAGPQAISRKVLAGTFVAPCELAPDVPLDLELVVFKMLQGDRRFRYASAADCAADLDHVIKGEEVSVPRVFERKGGKRHPLLPGKAFTLGRDEATCQVVVLDRSMSRQHARIERDAAGWLIRDLGSTYGTFVGGMRIKQDVVLKDGDEIQLGRVMLEFRDGGLARFAHAPRPGGAEVPRARTLPWPLIQGLTEAADKRVVLPLIETLAPDAIETRLEAARRTLKRALGGERAEAVGSKLEGVLRKARMTAPPFLFAITHENLGDDAEGWLAWWDHARESYPPQLAPNGPEPLRQLRVTRGETEPRVVVLGERGELAIGRDEKLAVPLQSHSVSRLHATLVRLHERVVIRDEGSRFGTFVNGKKASFAFLASGDRIELGKVELVYEVVHADPSATEVGGEAFETTPEAFFALAEQKDPAVALGLLRILEAESPGAWIEEEARKLFSDEKRAGELAKSVRRALERRAKQAREVLPALLGPCPEATPAAWRTCFEKAAATLPAQVLPTGFFPASGPPARDAAPRADDGR